MKQNSEVKTWDSCLEGAGACEPIDEIVSIVSTTYDVHPELIMTGRRGLAREAMARQIAMYLAHTSLGLAQHRVASSFGRDRTTVVHACQRIENRREEVTLDQTLDCLAAILRISNDRN